MKARTGAEMRELDRMAIQNCNIPGIQLMEHAGAAVAFYAEELAKPFRFPDFLCLTGKGNNGGDAFIAARLLSEKGRSCKLFLTCPPEQLAGDAAEAFRRLPESIKKNIKFSLSEFDFSPESIIIDGLLGTGIRGTPRSPADEWIRIVNQSGQPVLSIDIPSGLDSDSGAGTCCIKADKTVTFAAHKRGMFHGIGPDVCGMVHLAPIGFPKPLLETDSESDTEIFTEYDFRKLLRKDPWNTHKYHRGTLLTAGGSEKYPGAPYLAAVSALHGGAGLVMLLVPEHIETKVAPSALIVHRVPDSGTGCWTSEAEPALAAALQKANAVVIGPGMTADSRGLSSLKMVLSAKLPTVLDADALNLLAEHPHLKNLLQEQIILTPHPGEMRRLQNAFHLNSNNSRKQQAEDLSGALNTTVVLKGQHTVVASPDGKSTLNTSGTPALATAGSGDCLAGLCGAFLANGYSAADAARMAVFLHGQAAERAASVGNHGVIADDLPDYFTISGVFV